MLLEVPGSKYALTEVHLVGTTYSNIGYNLDEL